MRSEKKNKKIAVNDVFDDSGIEEFKSDSILSLAESIGKEEDKLRRGFLSKSYHYLSRDQEGNHRRGIRIPLQ